MLPVPSLITLSLTVSLAFGTDPSAAPLHQPAPATAAATTTVSARSQEPPATEVELGDVAPDFSYQAVDGRWRKLTDLRAYGPVLLVIAPDAVQLRALQREREQLLDLGVVPVAIADLKPNAAWSLVRELGLTYSVLADPRRVIAAQFNALDSRTQAASPAWFVVDRTGHVRACGHGSFPTGEYAPMASRALGIPEPGATKPASH